MPWSTNAMHISVQSISFYFTALLVEQSHVAGLTYLCRKDFIASLQKFFYSRVPMDWIYEKYIKLFLS